MIPALNSSIVGGMPLEQFFKMAGELGYGGADLDLGAAARKAQNESLAAVQDLFDSTGVRPASFGLPVDFRGDEEKYKAGLQSLPKLCELAVAIDCPRVITWIMPTSDERPYEENMKFHVDRLKPVMDIFREHGIRFGIEFVAPKHIRSKKHDFIWNIAGALELGDRIGGEGTGLLLDSFHWFTSGATVQDILDVPVERIVHAHVNDAPDKPVAEQIDNQRIMPGEGIIDLKSFLGALKKMGYKDFLSIEVLGPRAKEMPPLESGRYALDGLKRILAQI